MIGGTAGGRRLHAPPGRRTRPTSDSVREAIFNILASRDAIEGHSVLDLFAGTGALGIEALSRGARAATFVEKDPRTVDLLRRNLEVIADHEERAHVVRADVLGWLEGPSRPGELPAYDVAFADPPYAFAEWDRALAGLQRIGTGLAVLESDAPVEPSEGWEIVRQKAYGGTVVTLIQPLPRLR